MHACIHVTICEPGIPSHPMKGGLIVDKMQQDTDTNETVVIAF